VVAFVNKRSMIEQILGHLGLPTTGPPTAPAPPAGILRFGAVAR
jgi:hypothetical protein